MNTTSVTEFMEEIQLPEEGKEVVLNTSMIESIYLEWKYLFYHDAHSFFKRLSEEEKQEELALYLYVRFAVDAHGNWQARGIIDEIYYDTMKDITIWCLDCERKKGVYGLSETKWLSLHIKGKIFQLGRLQFELEGTLIHVHIPEGSSLEPSICDESFAKAEEFFDESYQTYDCDSWLLSSELKKICPEDSNIIRFQNRFDVQKVTHPFLQAEERVFGEIREDKTSYPEDTSLQRALKLYVLDGKEPGMGYGIIKRK